MTNEELQRRAALVLNINNLSMLDYARSVADFVGKSTVIPDAGPKLSMPVKAIWGHLKKLLDANALPSLEQLPLGFVEMITIEEELPHEHCVMEWADHEGMVSFLILMAEEQEDWAELPVGTVRPVLPYCTTSIIVASEEESGYYCLLYSDGGVEELIATSHEAFIKALLSNLLLSDADVALEVFRKLGSIEIPPYSALETVTKLAYPWHSKFLGAEKWESCKLDEFEQLKQRHRAFCLD